MKQYFWLLKRSIFLDIKLFSEVPYISWRKKFVFVYHKYLAILLSHTKYKKDKVKKGKSFTRDFYFNDEFATGLLQSIYCHNYVLRNYLPVSPIVVDIGANIGQFYTFVNHYLKASKVISFEPIKLPFYTLKLNSNNIVINAAIGPHQSLQEIFIDDRDIFASLVKPTGPTERRVTREMVNVVRLDEVKEIIHLENIDLLKIDTEGYELEILRSSPLTINKSKFILVECSVNRPSSGGLEEVCKFMVDKWPQFQLIDIINPVRKNNQIEFIELVWKNIKL